MDPVYHSIHQPVPQGNDGRLGTVGDTQFGEYRADIIADGAFREEQFGGDVRVRADLCQQAQHNTIIQANATPDTATYRVFEVVSTGNLTLDGVTVRHGNSADYDYGGGIANYSGTLTVTNSTISGNSAAHGRCRVT